MSKNMKRLSAQDFINEVKQVPGWALIINASLGEIELIVQHENQEPVSYLGPNPIETNPLDYEAFMIDLEKCASPSNNHTFGGVPGDNEQN
jgi:hypothetical protein